MIGIHFGTHTCSVTVDGQFVESEHGNTRTPAAVYYESDGNTRIGEPAVSMEPAAPDRVVWNDGWAREERHVAHIDGDAYTAVDVAIDLLRELYELVRETSHAQAEPTVLTVPANFTTCQQGDIERAARSAGFETVTLLTDIEALTLEADSLPTARGTTILVVALGEEQFDVATLELTDEGTTVREVEDETPIRGLDFTQAFADYLATEYERESGVDIRDEKLTYGELRSHADRVKLELSDAKETSIVAPALGKVDNELVGINRGVTREEFLEATDGLHERIRTRVAQVTAETGTVDHLLVTGPETECDTVVESLEGVVDIKNTRLPDRVDAVAEGTRRYTEAVEQLRIIHGPDVV